MKPQFVRSSRLWLKSAFGIIIVVIFLFPVYWMFSASLQSRAELVSGSPQLLPTDPDFSGYATAFSTQLGSLSYSLVIAVGATVVAVALAVPIAFAIVCLRLRFVTAFLAVVLIVQMLPTVVIANALYAIYNSVGLLNTPIGLILADATLGLPFSILVLRAFMAQIPTELLEAARIDGASYWRAFCEVIVPVSRNGIITVALFCFLFAWSDFMLALILGTNAEETPITVGIYRFISAQSTDWNAAMATALLAAVPSAVLLIACQRFIAAGLTAGSGK